MTGTPEFSRRIPIDRIGERPTSHSIAATSDERSALSERFGLGGIGRLEAEIALAVDRNDVVASGTVTADVTQACVVTGDDVSTHIAETFEIRLRPRPATDRPEEEVEIEANDLDIDFHDGEAIDIGELAAETAMLALPLFPRSAHADEAAREAGIVGEEEAGPFGALKDLHDRLSGRND